MPEPSAIGRNLKRRREERGLSQEGLAQAAEVSVDVVRKLEQGRRQSARITTLTKLANGLDVELAELADKRERLGADRDGGSVLAVRDVLLSPSLLPGLDADDGGEPTPAGELAQAVARAWAVYWAGDFGEVLAVLPGLIGEARHSHAALGTPAVEALTCAYDLASSLMTQIGRTDLGIIAAERAITTAYQGDDRLLWAVMHASYSWTLLHQGRHAEAEDVAARMAEQVEPSFRGDDLELSVWGNLLLTTIAPVVAQDRDPSEYLRLAAAGAARLERPVRAYHHAAFSPVTVAMQETYGYSVLAEPGKALKAARSIGPADLHGISRGAHLMDVAQAHLDSGHLAASRTTLLEAKQVSGVWFRHQRVARSVAEEIRERERQLTPETRTLVKALDLD
ncbi:helix-turn-helix domain-containing protein [Actinomadura sp. SCN-SB]|uniref:helix-turn-helix domain-containing protein n=1 Tax=Actinomadura sp. SCN-SB TaxID=3373092 RepID=UPI00375323B8